MASDDSAEKRSPSPEGASLRDALERRSMLLDASREGTVLHDQGKIIEVNRALAEMFGYRPSEMIGLSDNGSGISPDVMPKIFEPFFTTKPVGKGTGLGLSLVFEVVRKHGGAIDVESRPGLTRFLVAFPVLSPK